MDANTGHWHGKWLRLLVHVSLCSVLFVIAPDGDQSAGGNTSALCDSAVIYLTCGASELEPVSVVTADRSSAFIKTSTLFMFCIGLASLQGADTHTDK